MSLWDDLDAAARKPGPTMTITKAQYGALVGLSARADRYWMAIDRHVEIMANIRITIANVTPKQLGIRESAGFYELRRWVTKGLDAAESQFVLDPRLRLEE